MKKKPLAKPVDFSCHGKAGESGRAVSKCCSAKVETVSSREGTCFYKCSKCQKACDLK